MNKFQQQSPDLTNTTSRPACGICVAIVERVGRFFGMPLRYLVTRQGTLRLRYVTSFIAIAGIIGGIGAWNLPSQEMAQSMTRLVSRDVINGIATAMLEPSDYRLQNASIDLASLDPDSVTPEQLNAIEPGNVIQAGKPVLSGPVERNLNIESGDTLAGVLLKAGIGNDDAVNIVSVMSEHHSPKKIRPGQDVKLTMLPRNGRYDFEQLALRIDPVSTVTISRGIGGGFAAKIDKLPLTRTTLAARVKIRNSMYGSAAQAGVPNAVIATALRALAHTVDFQRDVKSGDSIDLMYEVSMTPDGTIVDTGNLLLTRVNLSGKEIGMYRYESKDGEVSYYRPDGFVAKKALLRTPIDGARMSSGFGMRRHPVMGYSRMHKGVDFAAPTGTPIVAAGDGVVEKASWFSSYGNYVKIRHNSSLKTAYAHMSRYGKGIKPGVRVKQGQIIGYVGTTGRSTGPHLHYETLVNNVQVHPSTIKMPEATNALNQDELRRFKDHVRRADDRFNSALAQVRQASYQATEEPQQNDGDSL